MAPSTLTITLRNQTTSNTVFAHITGIPVDKGGICFMKSDGKTPYYPPSPDTDLTPVSEDIAIPLAAPGSSSPTQVTVPRLASGRICFSIGKPLVFFVNKGPALVQPSITNASDPNYNTLWGFCEFTLNGDGLFANISYVDFVALPIAMSLTNASGTTTSVLGMPANGMITVCSALQQQAKSDGAPWDKLIFPNPQQPIRVLSPYNAMVTDGSKFAGYWEPYIDQVWNQYQNQPLTIDTQGGPGIVQGKVDGNGIFDFGDAGKFHKPSSADIFSCNTGPFGGLGNTTPGNIAARICAAFNRSTIHSNPNQPHGEKVKVYYVAASSGAVPTNHYSRVVHEANSDHRGYAFPYDDVVPNQGMDQAGIVKDGEPREFVITVGGLEGGHDVVRKGLFGFF
jgi:hypothetical protein